MAERMTSIHLPGLPGAGFAHYGRHTPEHMISLIRQHAATELRIAQMILDASDEAFQVETYTGVHVQRNVEVIQKAVVMGKNA